MCMNGAREPQNMSKPETDGRLELALFSLAYHNQIASVAGSFLLPAIIVFAYHASLPRATMWCWLGWMFGVGIVASAIRWHAWRIRRQQKVDVAFARRWRRWYLMQSMLVGVGWGNIGMLYVPDAIAQNTVLLITVLGVAASATNSSGAHHFKMVLYAIGMAFLIHLLYLPRGFGQHALPMQFMLGFYLLVLLISARSIHRAVLDNLRLRLENEVMLRLKTQEAQRADQANHDKSLFLAAASHDLRQPVHALLLLVAALRQRCREASQLELIEHIQQAGQAIGKLFNALMELSRLESGSEKPERSEVCVAETLAQAIQQHRLEAQHKGLRLELFVSRAAQCALADTDRVLLTRIIDNLIANAIRYTVRGGVLVALRVRHNQLLLDVIDTGIGIAAENLVRIYEPYFQVGNVQRDRSKGLGLGLAIVRQTSALLGHDIEVASRVGQGTRFRLTLHEMHIADAGTISGTGEIDHGPPMLAGWRVLVVDDDPMVRQAMQILLGSWQADLRSAIDADDCLRLLQDSGWQPDCILCDYRLPGTLDGIALLNQLVDRYPDVVALLQTGELDPQVRDLAEDAGYLVLTKPVEPELLSSTLTALSAAHAPKLGLPAAA